MQNVINSASSNIGRLKLTSFYNCWTSSGCWCCLCNYRLTWIVHLEGWCPRGWVVWQTICLWSIILWVFPWWALLETINSFTSSTLLVIARAVLHPAQVLVSTKACKKTGHLGQESRGTPLSSREHSFD